MDLEAPGIKIDGFGGSRHRNRWIWRLQASKSADSEAPGIEIARFGSSRHQNRWIWRLQASELMDLEAPGSNVHSDVWRRCGHVCPRLWSLVDVCRRLSTFEDVVAWWHGGLQGVNPLAPGGMFSQPDDPKGSADFFVDF